MTDSNAGHGRPGFLDRLVGFLASLSVLAMAGCTCGGGGGAQACNRDLDCLADEICRDGLCRSGSRLDAATLDSTALDRPALDTLAIDAGLVDVQSQDTGLTDSLLADTTPSDTLRPDTHAPDTTLPDIFTPDTAAPDTLMPDTALPDTFVPDTALPDTLPPDTAAPDTLPPDASPPAWWDTRYERRRMLRFDNRAQTESLLDVPVLLRLNNARIDYGVAQPDGRDLRFVDADGMTELPYERERWDPLDTSLIWVRVPQIDGSSAADHIWMYYGRPSGQDGEDPIGVWSPAYSGVYHLGGDADDSTGNLFHGITSDTTEIPGYVGDAYDFDGATSWVNLGADRRFLDAVSGCTLSAWVRPSALTEERQVISVGIASPATSSRCYLGRIDDDPYTGGRSVDNEEVIRVFGGSATLTVGVWNHLTGVVDFANSQLDLYLDGVLVNSSNPTFAELLTPDNASGASALGSEDQGTTGHFSGVIDEARIERVARSADWVRAQHLSMTDQLVVFGAEEIGF